MAKVKILEKKTLVAVAKDLNDVMELDPAIDIKQEAKKLQPDVIEAAGQLEPDDELKASTVKTLEKLGVELPEEAEEEEEPETCEECGELVDECTCEEEPEEEEEEKPKAKKGKAKGKAKTKAKDEDEEEEKPKAKKGKAKGKAKAKDEDEEEEAPKKKRSMTRIDAVAAVLNDAEKAISTDDICDDSDALYEENGGKSNPKEALWATNMMVKCLRAMDLIKDKDGMITLK